MPKQSDPDQAPFTDQVATATQAGLEKALFDELTKGLNCAARSLGALDDEEQLRLLAEAEIAYQNAVYLVEQSGTLPESPIEQKLHQLGTFLEKNETLQQETNRPWREPRRDLASISVCRSPYPCQTGVLLF